MRWVSALCCVAGVLVTSLLVVPRQASAKDEIQVVIPDDPFVPEFAELNEIRNLQRSMGAEHYRPLAKLVTAMNAAITQFNVRAREHRALALTLRKDVDAFLEDRSTYAEEDARFRAACQPPPSKAAVADCRTWAAKLDGRLEALKARKIDLAQRASELDRALEEGLVAGLRRLRVESVMATRDALKARVQELRQQKGAFRDVRGAVTRRQGGSRDAVQPGDPSVAGAYDTGPDSSCVITLEDGGQIVLGPDSTFELYDAVDAEREGFWSRLRKGVIRLVTEGRGRRPIRGPGANSAVRGTELILDAPPTGGMVVIVLDGHVTVTPDGGGPAVELEAPQRVEIGPDGTAGPVTRADPAAVDRWWRRRMGLAEAEDASSGDYAVPPLLLLGAAFVLLVLAARVFTRWGGAR